MYKGFATTNNEAHYNDLYYFYVELRDSSRNVLASFSDGSQENPLIANQNWQTSSYNFSYYGLGLRYIYIESGGRDNENWLGGEGGGYGTLIDSAVVKLDPNNTMNVDGVTLDNIMISQKMMSDFKSDVKKSGEKWDLVNTMENRIRELKKLKNKAFENDSVRLLDKKINRLEEKKNESNGLN